MDDGSIQNKNNNNYISIHSNSYDLETHYKFIEKFKKYNIECTIHKTRKYYYLNFNSENSKKLIQLVKPYIHNSMLYNSRILLSSLG